MPVPAALERERTRTLFYSILLYSQASRTAKKLETLFCGEIRIKRNGAQGTIGEEAIKQISLTQALAARYSDRTLRV